jgi:hypothetical protein
LFRSTCNVFRPKCVCINSATAGDTFSFQRVQEWFDGFQNLVQVDRICLLAIKFNERDPFAFSDADVVAVRFRHGYSHHLRQPTDCDRDLVGERQNHRAAASDLVKCKKRTTAAPVHFIVQVSRCRGGDIWKLIVLRNGRVWQWAKVNLSEGERRWMLRTISLTERLDHDLKQQQQQQQREQQQQQE